MNPSIGQLLACTPHRVRIGAAMVFMMNVWEELTQAFLGTF